MKLFENKVFAICMMILMILAGTFYSGIMDVKKMAENVEYEYVAGKNHDGQSISRNLMVIQTRANNIVYIAKNYIKEDELEDSLEYIDVLKKSEDKSELAKANQNLKESINSLYSKCMDLDVKEKDVKSLKEEKEVFDHAMGLIEQDSYNQLVEEYKHNIKSFTGSVFAYFQEDVDYFK